MADGKNVIADMWLKLRADLIDFHNDMIKAGAEVKSFVGRLGANSAEMQKFGKSVGFISLALAGVGGLATKVFADFEQSMANTFSVLGSTGAEMEKLSDYAREMGSTTVFKASQAADAMYYLASAGYKTNQIMGALKGTLDLAAATQYDLAETTRIVVGTLNAFNLEADQAGRISNLFAAAISNSQATMDRLGESMKIAAPITNTLDTSVEQLTSNFSALYNAGIDASTAGTNVRQIFTKLLNPTNDARKALAKLGLKVSDVSPQLHSLTEIVEAFEKAGAGAKDKTDELVKVFDLRAVGAMSVLLKTGSAALYDMERRITGTSKASEMAKTQIDTLKGSIKLFLSAAQEMSIIIGKKLAPIIRTIVDAIKGLISGFNDLSPTLQTVLVAIPALAAAIGLLLSPVALLIGYIPKLIAAWKTLTVVISGTTGAVLGWVAVIGLLIGAVIQYTSATDDLSVSTEEALNNIKNYNTAAINQRKTQTDLINSFLELADKTNKTNKEIEREEILFEKIKKQYPDLISGTDDYKTSVSKLKSASETLNSELEDLYKQQAQLRSLEIRIQTSKLKKDIRELKDELNDTSLSIGQMFKAGFRTLGDTSAVQLEITRKKMEKLATTAEGISRLKTSLELRTAGLEIAEEKLIKIRDQINTINEDDTKSIDIKNQEIDKLKEQEKENENLILGNRKLIEIYTGALEKGAQLLGMETQIKENQAELNKLKEKGIIEPNKVETNIITDIDEPDTSIQKKMNDLILSMQKTRLEAELSNLSINKEKELSVALKYAELEYKLKKAITEKEKADDVIAAKEVGASVKNVNDAYKEREIAEENAYKEKINQIRKKFTDKYINEEKNRIDSLEGFNEQELISYRNMLAQKLITLEKWSDEYKSVLDEIKSINDQISAPEENKLQFALEMSQYSTDEDQKKVALENYKEFLDNKILLEQEYTDKWYEYVMERARIEKELIDIQTDDLRNYFDEVLNIIDAGLNQAVDEYLIVTRKAKSSMDAIWITIENAAIRAMTSIVQAEITKLFLKILGKIAGYLTGAGGITDALGGGLGDFNMMGGVGSIADTGGVVKRSGYIKVKPQEVIVPGEVVRATRNKYESSLVGASANDNMVPSGHQKVENHNTYLLVNPMVDDQGFWENVFENKMIPAQETANKRMGKKK